jgi:hypothetical protein
LCKRHVNVSSGPIQQDRACIVAVLHVGSNF